MQNPVRNGKGGHFYFWSGNMAESGSNAQLPPDGLRGKATESNTSTICPAQRSDMPLHFKGKTCFCGGPHIHMAFNFLVVTVCCHISKDVHNPLC